MTGTSPLVVQTLVSLAVLTFMVVAGLKKRMFELRAAPARRPRRRAWRRAFRN